MVDLERWENEGGRLDADWEPSESEVYTINVKLSAEEVKYRFTCLMSDAIRHVKKYFFTRVEVAFNNPTQAQSPSVAQQVGEFVTEIRRLLKDKYADLAEIGFRELTNTDLWANVGVPNAKYDYKWRFVILTTTGAWQMPLALLITLCENAQKMAVTDQTSDEEFREINNSLNNLLREQTALDSLIYKAKDLNAQAGVVVDNLCTIAEKLQECE